MRKNKKIAGKSVTISCKTHSNNELDRTYRNRKGLWGITILAGCDARGKFMMFSCNGSGSANDVLAWRWSKIKNEVLSPNGGKSPSLLPEKYFFIGDEAFVCEKQLLVPFSGRGIGTMKDSFNFHLSARRQVIERYHRHSANRVTSPRI